MNLNLIDLFILFGIALFQTILISLSFLIGHHLGRKAIVISHGLVIAPPTPTKSKKPKPTQDIDPWEEALRPPKPKDPRLSRISTLDGEDEKGELI